MHLACNFRGQPASLSFGTSPRANNNLSTMDLLYPLWSLHVRRVHVSHAQMKRRIRRQAGAIQGLALAEKRMLSLSIVDLGYSY